MAKRLRKSKRATRSATLPRITGSVPADVAGTTKIHLLDPGLKKYGDCILCQFGPTTVLIDGSHPGDEVARAGYASIPDQLADVLGTEAPFDIDLLIVTHAHVDHIGCLPALVTGETIRVKHALLADPNLGWGIGLNDADGSAPSDGPDALINSVTDAPAADAVRTLYAALREESRADLSDAALREFLSDAATLQGNYQSLVKYLRKNAEICALYTDPNNASVQAIVSAYKRIGLKIYGPTRAQLTRCAMALRDRGQKDAADAITFVSQGVDLAAAYRQALASYATLDDAGTGGSVGAALNDQSIIASFKYGGAKTLLTGDMQFAKPGISGIKDDVDAIRDAIAADAPFHFAKLGHHASNNAVAEAELDAYQAAWLGISTGHQGKDHPNADVLKLLSDRSGARWLRTDTNGLCTFTMTNGGIDARKRRGRLNDATPKAADTIELVSTPPETAAVSTLLPTTTSLVSQTAGGVELILRVPLGTAVDLNVSINVRPGKIDGLAGAVAPRPTLPAPAASMAVVSSTGRAAGAAQSASATSSDIAKLAGGRALPPLLFLTSRAALAANVGADAADRAIGAIRAAGQTVVDDLPAGVDAQDAAAASRAVLRGRQDLRGVVLLGGYDVIPPAIVDALDPELRRRVERERFQDTPDDFVVWSDDVFADVDEDTINELPVSRIPDGHSEALLSAVLTSPMPPLVERFGVRNSERPFAQGIFTKLHGQRAMLVSGPQTRADVQNDMLQAGQTYFMLHGNYEDQSMYVGEDAAGYTDAFGIHDVAASAGGTIVLAGCCWAALCSNQPANLWRSGSTMRAYRPDESIALTFLLNGANSFIGCTGSHYSPFERPYRHRGGRMHDVFWRDLLAGFSPAESLLNARTAYATEIPLAYAGRPVAPSDEAIERKTWRQFTCLGLGW